MRQDLRIALAQLSIVDGDKARNLEKIEHSIEQAYHDAADILVLPELVLTGFLSAERMKMLAEPRNGASLQRIQSLIRKYPVYVVYSFPEYTADDELYITSCLLDKTGQPLAYYRKTHLFTEESSVFSPGQELVTVDVEGIKLGFLTCYDIEFPEPARVLALKGVNLLIVNSANMEPYELLHRTFITARALENQIFVAYCNRIGSNQKYRYCGQSAVIAPTGRVAGTCEGDLEAIEVVDISLKDIEHAKLDFNYLRERRPVDVFGL